MRGRFTTLSVAAAAFTLLVATSAPAQAAEPETVTGGLITPLSVAVGDDGTVYVSQNFAGMLTRVAPGGEASMIFEAPARTEVGAVSATDDGAVFATTGGTRNAPNADLWQVVGDGEPTNLGDLYGFEAENNPDADKKYGLKAGDRCQSKVPRFLRARGGIVESHPYATALGDGVIYVADAAGNTILAVDESGVSAVAVLPTTKVTIKRALKREYDLDKCVIGKTYRAEGVPTDVELGPDGNLYVTTLPGAPEGLPNGSVYQVNPASGEVTRVDTGLISPVGIAISPTGDAYISQLFVSTIIKVPFGGEPEPFAKVKFPGDVEFSDGFVYATKTDLTNEGGPPAGKVLRWDTTVE